MTPTTPRLTAPIGWALFNAHGEYQSWYGVHTLDPARWADKDGAGLLAAYAKAPDGPYWLLPVVAAPSASALPVPGPTEWRCFHCSESFTDKDAAAEHFGTSEHQQPACQIGIAEYRRMEEAHRRQMNEDTDWHRAFYKLGSDHTHEMRRHGDEEYAQGLRDGVNLPADSPERAALSAQAPLEREAEPTYAKALHMLHELAAHFHGTNADDGQCDRAVEFLREHFPVEPAATPALQAGAPVPASPLGVALEALRLTEGVVRATHMPDSPVLAKVRAAITLLESPRVGGEAVSELPPEIRRVVELLHTQDNRITNDPVFAVRQKRVVYGLDPDYATDLKWVDHDGEVPADEVEALEALDRECKPLPNGARRLGQIEQWEFVTACLTEQGCKDFIACNGHNLNEPQIYAYGGYRNAEWIALRKWLMGLDAARPAAADLVASRKEHQ